MSNINRTYTLSFIIPADAIYENGHVNNVVYVQWMQDTAMEHYRSIGGLEAQGTGTAWFIREHRIEYLAPHLWAKRSRLKHGWKTFAASDPCANLNLFASQMASFWSEEKRTGSLWIQKQEAHWPFLKKSQRYLIYPRINNV